MITKFELYSNSSINEDVSLAKSLLTKLNVPLGEKNPDYLEIRKLLKGKEIVKGDKIKYVDTAEGYVGLFTKLHFQENVPVENLKTLLNQILSLKDYLTMLPKPITQYDNYEKITDDLRDLNSKKHINSWLKEMSGILKNEYKNLPDDSKNKFSDLILTWMNLEEDIRDSIYKLYFRSDGTAGKISLFKTFKLFLDDLSVKINSATEGFEFEDITKKIKKTSAQIAYSDFDKQIIVAYIPDAKTSVELGSSSWCISYKHGNHWETYNALKLLTKQYFIWNFNFPYSDSLCMVALTVDKEGTITYIHKKDDVSILGNVYQEYFKKWGIKQSIFKPLSSKELKDRELQIKYQKLLDNSSEIYDLSIEEFNKIISFFTNFNWNQYRYCVNFLFRNKMNDYFYSLIKENKIDILLLIEQDQLINSALEQNNLEIFYYLMENYIDKIYIKNANLNSIYNSIYEDIFNLNLDEEEIIKVTDYFTSKVTFQKEAFEIPRGFFDKIIEKDYLTLFKKFYYKIPNNKTGGYNRNSNIYSPQRLSGGGARSFMNFISFLISREGQMKPMKIIGFLIDNGAYNSRDMFIRLFDSDKKLYEKIINNSWPEHFGDIYSNVYSDSEHILRMDIIDDLRSKNKFNIDYYADYNIKTDIKSVLYGYAVTNDKWFPYLIDILIEYSKNGGINETIKEIFVEEKNSYGNKKVYEEVLNLSDEKIYSLLKYFPEKTSSEIIKKFIEKNNLEGIKKTFELYSHPITSLPERYIFHSSNKEIIRYILSKKIIKVIGYDEIINFYKEKPDLIDELLESIDYNVSGLYLVEDFQLFKKIVDKKSTSEHDIFATKEKKRETVDIWQFISKNLIYAIDNDLVRLDSDSAVNALYYGYIPDNEYGVNLLEKMFKGGCDPNSNEGYSNGESTLLYKSLDKGNYHIFKLLVEKYKQDPYKIKQSYSYGKDQGFHDPLEKAILSENANLIEYIISKYKNSISEKVINKFCTTKIKKENSRVMSDLVLKYVKPDISMKLKINLVHNYSNNFDIFVKLFDIYKPDPTQVLEGLSSKWEDVKGKEQMNLIKFLDSKGADIASVYEKEKRSKRLPEYVREYFKEWMKNRYKTKIKEGVYNFEDFKLFML
jgi:hypothetical protein